MRSWVRNIQKRKAIIVNSYFNQIHKGTSHFEINLIKNKSSHFRGRFRHTSDGRNGSSPKADDRNWWETDFVAHHENI